MFWISRSKLTLHNFTREVAASAANDDDPVVTLHHHSCMLPPLLAGNEIDMICKAIRYLYTTSMLRNTAVKTAGKINAIY